MQCFLLFQRLKDFISNSEQKNDLFVEEENTGLSMASQSTVMTHIFNFIKSEYSCQVEPAIAEEVCKAAVELFPSLIKNDSTIGGIVSFENGIVINKKFVV